MTLIDNYGRPLLKLRIVVNSVCNFSCIFCHFEGQSKLIPELTPEDIGFVIDAAMKVGINDYKITGGEPLLRKDIVSIIEEIAERRPSDISLTTNGYMLRDLAGRLSHAGLNRLNVSLHSLRPDRYRYITGINGFEKVMNGLMEAKNYFKRIKLNVVLLSGVNIDEVDDVIDFASKHGFDVQFIELMPVGDGSSIFPKHYYNINNIIPLLEKRGKFIGNRADLHNRPLFSIDGIRVELIKNYENPLFCAGCTTMRLTSNGQLKTCLYKKPVLDLWGIIKGRDLESLINAFREANSLREPNFKGVGSRITVRI